MNPTVANKETVELLPCPFCGAEAKLVRVEPIWWYVVCGSESDVCTCKLVAHDRERVIEQWNRR